MSPTRVLLSALFLVGATAAAGCVDDGLPSGRTSADPEDGGLSASDAGVGPLPGDAGADAASPPDLSSPDASSPSPACQSVRVITSGVDLNVREAPFLDAEVIGSLAEGTVVEVTAVVTGDAVEGEERWYEIPLDAAAGYVTAYWVECVEPVEPSMPAEENPRGLVPFDGFRLPFRCGKSVRVSQGNDTTFSHQGRSRYAFDFAVPTGTNLYAMAPGRVVNADSSTRPGDPCFDGGGTECRNEANYVRIKHSDGSITAYWHLNRALVSRGDRVAMGDLIARSGSSGYSTGPHTHVVRERDCDSIACQSIRLRFLDVRGDGVPSSGDTVTSGNCP